MSRTLPARLRRRARARRTRRSLRLESRRKAWVAASKRRVWVRRSWTWSGVGRLGAFFTSLRNLRTVFWMRSGFKDINFPCLELDAVGERRIAGHELIVSVPRRNGKPQGCEDSAESSWEHSQDWLCHAAHSVAGWGAAVLRPYGCEEEAACFAALWPHMP